MRLTLIPLIAKLKLLEEAAGAYTRTGPPVRRRRQHPEIDGEPPVFSTASAAPAGQAQRNATDPRPAIAPAARSADTQRQIIHPLLRDFPSDSTSRNPASGSNENGRTQISPAFATDEEALEYWDRLNGIAEDYQPADAVDPDLDALLNPGADIPPEHLKLALPSNGNTDMDFEMPEIAMRRKRADTLLSQIREIIAEKSFRYTEQLRAAPRKGVKTRARTAIDELERQLSFLCQVYTHCRDRMIDLGVDREVLNTFRQLSHDDVRCSTAVLKPNERGSTQLKLSWIWQSLDRRVEINAEEGPDSDDPATILECEYLL